MVSKPGVFTNFSSSLPSDTPAMKSNAKHNIRIGRDSAEILRQSPLQNRYVTSIKAITKAKNTIFTPKKHHKTISTQIKMTGRAIISPNTVINGDVTLSGSKPNL